MFATLIILIGLGAPVLPPRILPPVNRNPITASPYPCMVGIEFVDGTPVLEVVCGL